MSQDFGETGLLTRDNTQVFTNLSQRTLEETAEDAPMKHPSVPPRGEIWHSKNTSRLAHSIAAVIPSKTRGNIPLEQRMKRFRQILNSGWFVARCRQKVAFAYNEQNVFRNVAEWVCQTCFIFIIHMASMWLTRGLTHSATINRLNFQTFSVSWWGYGLFPARAWRSLRIFYVRQSRPPVKVERRETEEDSQTKPCGAMTERGRLFWVPVPGAPRNARVTNRITPVSTAGASVLSSCLSVPQ